MNRSQLFSLSNYLGQFITLDADDVSNGCDRMLRYTSTWIRTVDMVARSAGWADPWVRPWTDTWVGPYQLYESNGRAKCKAFRSSATILPQSPSLRSQPKAADRSRRLAYASVSPRFVANISESSVPAPILVTPPVIVIVQSSPMAIVIVPPGM